jgi:DNA-binding response OmpR family regulator
MNVVSHPKPVTEESQLDRDSSVTRSGSPKPPHLAIAPTRPSDEPANPEEDVYDDGYLRVEHQNYYFACEGRAIFLTRVEFLLVSRLAKSMQRVVSSEELWRAAWGNDKPLSCGSLHVYIHRVRTKLRPYNLQIDALVNVGYRLIVLT